MIIPGSAFIALLAAANPCSMCICYLQNILTLVFWSEFSKTGFSDVVWDQS